MATTVNVHEAKTQLSRLLVRVSRGEEIIIAKSGKPIAKLIPLDAAKPRLPGSARGRLKLGEDFDMPLPEDLLETFER
ncbi:MAG: type II toxin-antitoxin system Phd/YefM family antitoxin [Bacillota bacterium]|nr:type II toxin-antitoxin system Phd/YefM family antitoxin [Bacillota bacterium]